MAKNKPRAPAARLGRCRRTLGSLWRPLAGWRVSDVLVGVGLKGGIIADLGHEHLHGEGNEFDLRDDFHAERRISEHLDSSSIFLRRTVGGGS